MVSNVQNNVKTLLFLHSVLVSNKLETRGLLTIYGLCPFPSACMAIAFEQVLSGSLHRLLNCLLTFRGSEGTSGIILHNNTAEILCHGCYFAHAKHMDM